MSESTNDSMKEFSAGSELRMELRSEMAAVVVVTDDFSADAFLLKPGTVGEVLEQSFANLQQLNNWERPQVLQTLVDKFSPKVEKSAVEYREPCSKDSHDGSEPLLHSGYEAVAQYLSSPKPEREFRNITELAKYVGVTSKTIHLWKKLRAVIKRVQYLTVHRKLLGDQIGRREWPVIMKSMCVKAKQGDVAAAKFVAERAWSEEGHVGTPGLTAHEMIEQTLAVDVVCPSMLTFEDGE